MGKVQKKAVEKHKLSLSPAITEFIDKAISLPIAQLPQHFFSIPTRWPFPRGDLYNWIDVLDRFDEVLQKFNKTYGLCDGPQTRPFGTSLLLEVSPGLDLEQLRHLGFGSDGDRQLVESILAFSRLLLEKCGNRTLYNSTERLNDLLNTTSLPLLYETLRLTSLLALRYAERPSQTTSQAHFYHFDLERIQKLAGAIPRPAPRRTPQSPTKTTKSRDKASQPRLRRTSTAADPNDFKALARSAASEQSGTTAKAHDLDWSVSATVKVTWPAAAPSAPVSRPTTSRLASSDLPSSPTPLRQQSVIGSASKPSNVDTSVTNVQSVDQSGTQTIELTAADLSATSIHDILKNVSEDMPSNVRYELLYKLRTAYALLDSTNTRSLLLQIRLTAICIVGQIYSEEELTSKFFGGDGNASVRQQLVLHLASLLRDTKQLSSPSLIHVQCLAMETLTILSRFRQISAEILAALSPNSSHGLMMSLVQRGLADIAQDGDSTDNDAGDDWREAIFMMWTIIMAQSGPHHARSSEQYIHKSLITAYVSALQTSTTKALRVHSRVLEFLKTLFHHFKDGLQVLNANGAFATACEATYKLSQEALEFAHNDQGMPKQFKNQNTDYQVPYLHQQVLRSLVELVDDISGHQGNHADRALRGFVDSGSLLSAFRLILSHMEDFGAHTWSKVVKAVCGFLNNEPTSFTVVSEAGIINTLLSVIQPQSPATSNTNERQPKAISAVPSVPTIRLPPIADAITNLASAFGAICLTEAGHNQFVASNVLEKFFELFESPEHIKAIKDSNTFLSLGSTFDELVRHHPGLKDPVVSSVITMIARVQYICKSQFKRVGAGPKLWETETGPPFSIAGGVRGLLHEDLPGSSEVSSGAKPLRLPNGDTLTFGSLVVHAHELPTLSFSDQDTNGLTALDYARPVIGFLAAFLDGRYMCKEIMNAGATDMILDFVTLPTLPIVEDTFSDALLMQELTTVIRTMAEERPYLVLPLLVDRARFICKEVLLDFVDFQPDSIRCFFSRYLTSPGANSALDANTSDEAESLVDGTRLVKGLMNIYSITKVLAEVFMAPSYPARASHNSILVQVNIADILAEMVTALGKLSAACCREEISLLSLVPKTLLDATRPGHYSTGDHDVDAILDVSDSTDADHKDGDQQNQDSTKQLDDTPAFRNLTTLRYLLTETPASIATLFSRIGCSFSGRKKPETIIKQKIHLVSTALAQALTQQLDPPFLSDAFLHNGEEKYRDWRFKYFTVVLSRLRDSLWEESATNVPANSIRQSFVVDCFRRADGLTKLTKIGTEFFDELKLCQVAKPVFAANVGLKICLELFDDLTHAEMVSSQQTAYLKNVDPTRPYYFNPSQLLLETRMECLKLTRCIWDSDYAEQASNDVIRRLIAVLKHTLEGVHEEHAIPRTEDYPKLKDHERRKFMIDKAKAAGLRDKGYDADLVDEALYRCNVVHTTQIQNAEEYCKAVDGNPQRRRLPIPANEIEYKGAATTTVPQLASSSSAMDTTPGPTTTIFEDTSLDEDLPMPHDAPLGDEASIMTEGGANESASMEDRSGQHEPSTLSAMSISSILNAPQPVSTSETQSIYSRQSIDNERSIIRDQLPERCNNILSNHSSLTFDLNDLLCAAASRLDDDTAQEWWKSTTDLLVSSLISQSLDEELSEIQGKKIAATAHLVGLLCSNESFKPSMLSVLQEHIEPIIGFLQISNQKPATEDSSPWVAPVLLILEKLLALDADPDEVIWSDPTDLESWSEPRLNHRTVIDPASKELLFHKIIEILPRVGKDRAMATSIARVLVILTRDRAVAQKLGERKNLQKLFLMVKQLAGSVDDRLESAVMVVLRHIIEDEDTIKSIMGSEITAYFRGRATPRLPDFTSYLRELNYLALRSPALFVAVSNEKIKLSSWTPGQPVASSTLTLREKSAEPAPASDPTNMVDSKPSEEQPTESIETLANKKSEDAKVPDLKVPVVEHPDGVIHFILSELLSYRDIEDKDPVVDVENDGAQPSEDSAAVESVAGQTAQDQQEKQAKAEKPRFKADDHPIFMYRCFLMHSLTELLYSYNQTKIEFISFSRKADPLAATPSKWRSGVLNYLLNNLVSSNYVDKDESINCKKRVTTSEWATRVLVALCTKTGEKDIGGSLPTRYTTPRQIEDNDDEPDLIYVRRFVLDHAIKSFKDTLSLPESMQVRYGRLLCLADLFNKLLTKPAGPEGSVFANNTSHKRLARLMLEKNLIAVLTAAISDIDLSFPGSKKVIKFILRPLKELTSAATYLSTHSPESFPQIENSPADNISSASSEVSEMDDDREETPDLYRNSALGMRDPARQNELDSDESEEDEDMYEDEYDDEDMEYEEEIAAAGNDGEVVSDEELEDVVDGNGPVQGLTGDVPMDIEFVVDHHHHHHHHHEGDSEDSSEDDDTEDGEDDDEDDDDIEIEIDEDGDMEHDGSDGHSDDEADDDGWEDEDGEDAEDDDDDAEGLTFDEHLQMERSDNASAHLNNLLRVLGEPDIDGPVLPPGTNVVVQANDPDDHDDEDDQDEDGDMDENDGMDYDQGFDMMLDGHEDYDENEEWGWEEPPPPVFRRSRGGRAGAMPGFFSRRVLNEHEMHHHILGTRHHRHAPSGRSAAEEGTNPLLQRPDAIASDAMNDPGYAFGRQVPLYRRAGDVAQGMPLVLAGGPRGPSYAIPMNAGGADMGGHGAILDAIMGAIQRGDQEFMQNGRIQFNIQGPPGDIRELLRPPTIPAHFLARQSREDPQRSAQFVPMLTNTRWMEEARMLFGKNLVTKSQPIQRWLMSKLVPLAQEEEKERLRKLEQQRIENERIAKEEEERHAKEEEERNAKEAAEAAERARIEEEARMAAADDEQTEPTEQQAQSSDAMEGVQSGEQGLQNAEATSQQTTRIYTTIRGRQIDITGLDIDLEYLEALPEDFREEVITQQYQVRREQAQEEGNDASGIDPDFLDALPEEIREEIRHQEAAAQRRRERERARQEAQSTGALPQTGMMDNDDFFATLDPALRRIILAEQPPEILNDLNPQHAAEGRAHARSHFFHHRLPMQRELETARNRRELAQREARRQQIVQLIDKAGVATLLRLMFLHQQGSLKLNLLNILSHVCGNRQTRYEVVSLLLVILKEGSVDVTAVERSLASLSLRAKASAAQKTPQPLKRTLSMQPYGGISEDVTPVLVVQQCLNTLTHICRANGHVRSLFLREVDVTSGSKGKGKAKAKGKEGKATTHPVNDLISLLDRGLIMNNSGCLLSLASLLAIVTQPMAALMRQEKERQKTEEEKEKESPEVKPESDVPNANQTFTAQEDVTMEDASAPSTQREPENASQATGSKVEVTKEDADATKTAEQDRKKVFEPPVVTDHNLKLITDIFVAPECGTDTFHQTLDTLQSLSHIPGASIKFGNGLTKHVHSLTKSICVDLEDLLPAIRDAQSSTDVQGVAAAKFSASTSDQVKLLRVLQALDYLSAPKKEGEISAAETSSPTILTLSYDSLSLGVLWRKLSECLTLVEEKGDTISFANILLPLIESLMVVCKHTTLKDTPVAQQAREGGAANQLDGEEGNLEDLFFKFTSEHRKILNDIVRQSPKLMQGHFSILVKNSKVLDFDNKRNYFSKQIHSRHHAQRHPQPPLQLNVRRDQVFIDSYKALYYKNPEEMKYGKLNIRFNGEEGVDAGGVTREWFQVLARGMFDPNYALWQPVASDRTTFHPSPLSAVNPEHLMYFKFVGRIIGKALHEGRVLDCHFSRAVYKRILGKSPNLKDLESNDMDYYKSLCWILENDITDIISEEFCVVEDEFGEEKVIDLIPDGRNISVTEDNKKEYVQRLVEYRLTDSVKDQLDSFLGGFHDIIPAELISIFNEQELELLISGLPEIDVDDWKANTEYHNYNPSSQQVVWFWRIVKAMTNEERAKLLQFITGTSKVPLNGFKELEGVSGLTKCNIHKDPSINRLPTSHTCFNQLDLPAYESFELMKHNITTAISLGADYFGFA